MSTVYKCDNCEVFTETREVYWYHPTKLTNGLEVVLNTDQGIYRPNGKVDLCDKCWYATAHQALTESEAGSGK